MRRKNEEEDFRLRRCLSELLDTDISSERSKEKRGYGERGRGEIGQIERVGSATE